MIADIVELDLVVTPWPGRCATSGNTNKKLSELFHLKKQKNNKQQNEYFTYIVGEPRP
jgi:hypothetical protein